MKDRPRHPLELALVLHGIIARETRDHIARECGINVSQFSDHFSGRQLLSERAGEAVLAHLGLSPIWLTGRLHMSMETLDRLLDVVEGRIEPKNEEAK